MDLVLKGQECDVRIKLDYQKTHKDMKKSACIGIIHHQTGSYWFFSDQSGPGGEINS